MVFQVSAGVNVSEVDLSTVVPAISTSSAGIAGHFRWGPAEKIVLVSSEDRLVETYNKPNSNTYTDFFTAANFLAYSDSLFVSRVIASDASTGTRNATTNAANTESTIIKNNDDYEDNYSSGISSVGPFVAKYPGELGNSLKVSVCPSSNAWSSTLTGNVEITTNTAVLTGNGTSFNTELIVGDLVVLGPDREVRKVTTLTNATSLILDARYSGNTITINGTGSSNIERRWEYFNFFDVAPGTSDFATTRGGSADELHIVVADEDGQFTGVKNQVLERFSNLSFAQDARTENGTGNYYKNVINTSSKYMWWTAHGVGNTNAGKNAAGVTFAGDPNPQTASFVNGRDGALPSNADYILNYTKFRNNEEYDIAFLLGAGANQTRALNMINNVAEIRKDCLVCLSPPSTTVVNNSSYVGKEVEDIIAFRNTLPSSSYAVLDSGWKYQYDKYNDINRYVPLNGDIAGLMARTDNVRDPWFSPAGYNRGNIKNVIRLAFNPGEKSYRDLLYKNGINPVVSFAGQGTVLFGDKTLLSKPSAFDRINVRRLFIVLEKAISTVAKFSLFEFNDDFTRAQFRNLVEPFLRDVQGRRGIEDFRVVADTTNNTAEVINRNEFVGDIYIKPARSINFIQLNFVAVRSGVAFDEIVGQF